MITELIMLLIAFPTEIFIQLKFSVARAVFLSVVFAFLSNALSCAHIESVFAFTFFVKVSY